MADQQDDNLTAAAEPEEAAGGNNTGAKNKKPGGVRVINFRESADGIQVFGIAVNDRDVTAKRIIRLSAGDSVSLSGNGLQNCKIVEFFQEGVVEGRKPGFIQTGPNFIRFEIPKNWQQFFNSSALLLLTFSREKGQVLALGNGFVFKAKADEEESKESKAVDARKARQAKAGAGADGADGMGALTQSVGDVIGGTILPFIPNAEKIAKRNELNDALKSGDKNKIISLVNELKAAGDTKGLREAASVSGREHLKFINDAIHGSGLAEIGDKETISRLEKIATSVNVEDYGGDEAFELEEQTQTKVGGETVSGVSGEARVEAEAGVRGKAETSEEVKAEIKTGTEERRQTASAGSAEIKTKVGGSVFEEVAAQPRATGAVQARVESQVAEKGAIKAAGGGGAAASQTVKRSAEIVGEHIDKNPQLINQLSVRENVLKALAEGRPESLGGQEQESLAKALKTIEATGGISAELKFAAESLGGEKSSQRVVQAVKASNSGSLIMDRVTSADMPRGDVISRGAASGIVDVSGRSGSEDVFEPGGLLKSKTGRKEFKAGREKSKTGSGGASKTQSRAFGPGADSETDEKEVSAGRQVGEDSISAQVGEFKKRDEELRRVVPSVVTAGKAGEGITKEFSARGLGGSEAPDQKISQQKTQPRIPKASRPVQQSPVDSASPKTETATPRPGGGDPVSEKMPEERKGEGLGPPVGPPLSSEDLAKTVDEGKQKEQKNKKDGFEKTDFDHLLPEQQKRDLAMAFQNGMELTDSQKGKIHDERLKLAADKANKLINEQLEKVSWTFVWGGAIETLGLTVLLGAIVGDILLLSYRWILSSFKDRIEKIIAPILQTKQLKEALDEIVGQIRIGARVKIHILLMNLAVLSVVLIIVLVLVVTMWWACQDWGLRGALWFSGYDKVCEYFDGDFSYGGGDSGGAGASDDWSGGGSGSGQCQPASYGPASVGALSGTCFSSVANQASSIARAESAGVETAPSSVDKCALDGKAVSWGLFQINLTVHKLGNLDCPSAFEGGPYTANNKNCRVINQPLYDQCVSAAKNPQINIQKACEIYTARGNWSAWGANSICKF